jgi:L-asparagine oxygenase
LLGEPFGWATQQDGHVVNDVFPISEYENHQLGAGSKKALTLHTEDAFHPYRADYIILSSLRNPTQVPVVVAVADFSVLSPEDLDVLFDERFSIVPDTSHLPRNNTIRTEADRLRFANIENLLTEHRPVAALFGARADPLLRFDGTYMTAAAGDSAAASAFGALCELLRANLHRCALLAGDLVLMDNHRVAHARSSFTARYDGTDRWLKRINVTRDLRKSRDLRPSAHSRLVG